MLRRVKAVSGSISTRIDDIKLIEWWSLQAITYVEGRVFSFIEYATD